MYAYSELVNKFNRSSLPGKVTYKLENNTYVIKTNQVNISFDISLHNSIIANITQDKIVLNSCNWRTPTTKDRLNKILSDNQTDFTIWQVNHVWYVYANGIKRDFRVKFADNITFNKNLKGYWDIFNFAQDNTQEINILKRKITKYVNQFYQEFTQDRIPVPSAGDCWNCYGITPMYDDKDHLLSHIEESYFVPSLLVNAVKFAPQSILSNELMACWINGNSDSFKRLCGIVGYQIKKSLYKYLVSKLITN